MLYHLLRAIATVAFRWYYADIVVRGTRHDWLPCDLSGRVMRAINLPCVPS